MLSLSILSNLIEESTCGFFLLTAPFLNFITLFLNLGLSNSFLEYFFHLFLILDLKLPEPLPINYILTTLGE
jgi:hypothetical protein